MLAIIMCFIHDCFLPVIIKRLTKSAHDAISDFIYLFIETRAITFTPLENRFVNIGEV